MKILLIALAVTVGYVFSACDVQSGMSKQSVEKFVGTPTPTLAPTPFEPPIDPADVVTVDTSMQGPTLSVNTARDKKDLVCDKYNRVMLNGGDKVVTIKGVCSQIMLNGNNNDVTAEAVMEIVFNGGENKVRYSRYGNGQRPAITDNNKGANLVEKVNAPPKK